MHTENNIDNFKSRREPEVIYDNIRPHHYNRVRKQKEIKVKVSENSIFTQGVGRGGVLEPDKYLNFNNYSLGRKIGQRIQEFIYPS